MKNSSRIPTAQGLSLLALTAALLVSSPARANFLFTDAGPYDYNDVDNWSSQTIDNQLNKNLTADQTLTFAADTLLSTSLFISNNSAFNHVFVGSGGNRTLTLSGNISLGSATNANTVTLGSTTDGQKLNLDLGGGNRIFSVGTNRTLTILNEVSGNNSITKTGNGTLFLSGTANTYGGKTSIGDSGQSTGVLVVTKLANGGEASSIGTSSNANGNLVFGGTATGTLRYIGSGDSTDRRFLIGGVGAIFDASGSGALHFTNAAAPSYASMDKARTITLTGTNTDENSMAAAFEDSGIGAISLLKDGGGTWALTGNSIYTGATTVTEGTLILAATGSIEGSQSVEVNAGATFDTTARNFEMLGSQTFVFTLDPTEGGSAGLLAAGALDITNGVVGFAMGGTLDDAVYVIASYTSLTGSSFNTVNSLPVGYAIDYAYNGGTQIALLAVPEPATLALLLGGLGLMAGRRRTRH